MMLQRRQNAAASAFQKVVSSHDNMASGESGTTMNKSTKDHGDYQNDSGSSILDTRLSRFEFSGSANEGSGQSLKPRTLSVDKEATGKLNQTDYMQHPYTANTSKN